MRMKSVTVGYGETRSVNFQSCYSEVWLEADLEPGETEVEVQLALEKLCVSMVESSFDRHEARKLEVRT